MDRAIDLCSSDAGSGGEPEVTNELAEAARIVRDAVERFGDELGENKAKLDSMLMKQHALELSLNTLAATVGLSSGATSEKLGELRSRGDDRERRQNTINTKLFERLEKLERSVLTKMAWVTGAWFALTAGREVFQLLVK